MRIVCHRIGARNIAGSFIIQKYRVYFLETSILIYMSLLTECHVFRFDNSKEVGEMLSV